MLLPDSGTTGSRTRDLMSRKFNALTRSPTLAAGASANTIQECFAAFIAVSEEAQVRHEGCMETVNLFSRAGPHLATSRTATELGRQVLTLQRRQGHLEQSSSTSPLALHLQTTVSAPLIKK